MHSVTRRRVGTRFARSNVPYPNQIPSDTLVVAKRFAMGFPALMAISTGSYDEVYGALDHDLRSLAAMGVRAVFDKASAVLGINPEQHFANIREDLENKGHIGRSDECHINGCEYQ